MNSSNSSSEKSRRTVFLRWELLAISVVMLLILAVAALSSLESISSQAQFLVYSSLVLLAGFILSISFLQRRRLESRLTDTQADLDRTQARLRQVFRLGHEFALVNREDEAIDVALAASLAVSGAAGISYLPLDRRGHARPLISQGDISQSALQEVAPHLTFPEVRSRCAHCNAENALLHTDCPLPFPTIPGIEKVYCLPVRRYGRELGMLNLYFDTNIHLDTEAESIINATVDEMGIVIEALRLRNRDPLGERAPISSDDLKLALALPELAGTYFELSGADFLILSTDISPQGEPQVDAILGSIPEGYTDQVQDLLSAACMGGSPAPVEMPFVPGLQSPRISGCSLRNSQGEILGGMVIGWGVFSAADTWSRRQIQTAADGLANIAEISKVMDDFEYRTVMSERNRLAREIHDGLAQNIGYIKLLAARMNAYSKAEDWDRLQDVLDDCRTALEMAYEDARGAIDNLIISPEAGFSDWVEEVAVDFQGKTGIQVLAAGEPLEVEPDKEAQVQMIRIVQEALTNVRKHAAANHVWIEWYHKAARFTLEIRDDGLGFQSDVVLDSSQFGLLSMRERAELIDADIQVVSSAQEGTIVRLRLPVQISQTKT